MAAPFLEILTRTYKRPQMLAVNRESVTNIEVSRDGEIAHVIMHDHIGRGVSCAQERLGKYAPRLEGRYIWILDDDDMCIRPTLLNEVKAIADVHDPDVITVKMDHQERGILPDRSHWGKPPAHGFIGCSAYIVKRETWQEHAAAWFPGTYYSDFTFIKAIFDSNPKVYWHDVIASRVQKISMGMPE